MKKNLILLFNENSGNEMFFYGKKAFELYKLGFDLYDEKKRELINEIFDIDIENNNKGIYIINKLECFLYIFSNKKLKEFLFDYISLMEKTKNLNKLLDMYVEFIRNFKNFEYSSFFQYIMSMEFENIFLNDKITCIKYNGEELLNKNELINSCKNTLENIKELYLHIDGFINEYIKTRRISINDYIKFSSLPKTEKILYIKENGKKIKLGRKLLIKEINKIDLKTMSESNYLKEMLTEGILYRNQYIEIENIYYENCYKIESFNDYLMACVNYILEKKIIIKKCKNCGKLFIPSNKVSEELCGYIYKNNKTCKELSYEIKLEKDEIEKIYRKNYKTQNAKKNRNQHIKDIDLKFEEWVDKAKINKLNCQKNKITIDEYLKWFEENNKNWIEWKKY